MRRVLLDDFDFTSPYTIGLPFFSGRIWVFIPAASMFFLTIRAQSTMPFPWADTLGCRRSVRKSRRNGSLFFWIYSKTCFRLCPFTSLWLDERTNSVFQNRASSKPSPLYHELSRGPISLHPPTSIYSSGIVLGFAH